MAHAAPAWPGEEEEALWAACSGTSSFAVGLGGGAEEDDVAAVDLRFLDALLPPCAEGHPSGAGGAGGGGGAPGAPVEPAASASAAAAAAACASDEAGQRHDDAAGFRCLDATHPPDCAQCTLPPALEDSAAFVLRSSKGAHTQASVRLRV
jgi:hypothetical protein